jgi:type VI secretion system secreted protein Hcp
MAVDMVLKIEPIKGESVVANHEGQVDVLAWSWSISNSGSMHIAQGGGSGKANVSDLSLTKWVDKASSDLMKFCVQGTHIDEATLYVRKAGTTPLEYIVITMKKILITSVSTGGSGGEDKLTENISLNFTEYACAYVPQKPDGSGDTAAEHAYNIAAGVEA